MWPCFQSRLSQRVGNYRGLQLNRSSTTSKTQATEEKKASHISSKAGASRLLSSPRLLLLKNQGTSACVKNPRSPTCVWNLGPLRQLGLQPACHWGRTTDFKSVR